MGKDLKQAADSKKVEDDDKFKRTKDEPTQDEEEDEVEREHSGIFTYESKLSPAYVQFTLDYKARWAWWNLGGIICNGGIGALTVCIIQSHPNECAGIKLASWAMFSLYIITFLF